MSEVFLLVWWSTVWNHRKKETTNKSTWQTSELLRCAFRFSMSSATANKFEVHQTSTHHPSLWLLRDVCQFHFSAFSENECRVLEKGVPTKSRQMCLINVFSLVRNGLGCVFNMMRCNTCSVRNLVFFGQTCEMKGKEFGAIGMMYDDIAENHWAALVSHGLAETSKLKALRPSSDAYIYIYFLCVRTYNTWYISRFIVHDIWF